MADRDKEEDHKENENGSDDDNEKRNKEVKVNALGRIPDDQMTLSSTSGSDNEDEARKKQKKKKQKLDNRDGVYGDKDDNTSEKVKTLESDIPAPESESQKRQQEETRGSKWVLIFAVLIIVIAIAAFFILPHLPDDNKIPTDHRYRTVEAFRERFKNLEAMFTGQHQYSFNMLRNSGIRHLNKVYSNDKSDLTPMSYLIVSFESSDLAICFGKKLSEAFTHKQLSEIDSSEFNEDTEENEKMKLDDEIKTSLKDTQKVVVVQSIEKLNFTVAQLFMTYADSHNDIATYPQSTIVLTASLTITGTGDRKTDERLVADYFRETLWKGQANINSIAALWTRVGDGLVVLKNADSNPCKKSEF